MFRTLYLATAIGLLLPIQAYTLGLGGITNKSFLNQKFNANIELLSINQNEMDTIKIGLASAEAFAKAGVERAFHLHGLRFEAIYQNNESAVIHVSSQEPIREPFLDFLVEARWENGQVLREYTVLLDPPNLEQSTDPAQTPNSLEYGPVTNTDTLWSIANKMRQPGTSITQVIDALLAQNPDAFVNANPNNLLEGKTLHLRLYQRPASKQSGIISANQKPVAQKTPTQQISPPSKITAPQSQPKAPLSTKLTETEIKKLWESLEALHKSEQHRLEQTQALFDLIEELNFKVGDIQLMLIEHNTQAKTVASNETITLDEATTEEISTEIIASPAPILTSTPQLVSNTRPDPVITKHEASKPAPTPATITKNNTIQQQSNNSYTPLSIAIGTFATLIFLLKVLLARRNQIPQKNPVSVDSESSSLEPATNLSSVDEPSELLILPQEPNLDVDLKEWESDVEQELNQLLEQEDSVKNDTKVDWESDVEQELNQLLEQEDSVKNDTKVDTDYISKMVTTLELPASQPSTDEQDIADYLEEPAAVE